MISHFLNLLKKKLNPTFLGRKQGFTLIELIVSIGIMVVITTVVLVNYTTFNKRIKLEGVTQEVASIVRETQAYGMGNKVIAGASKPYGVHFDVMDPYKVIIFSDNNNSNRYNTGEEEETFQMQSSSRIIRICINQKTPLVDCNDSGGGADNVSTLDVVYKRSDIYAIINDDDTISDAEILFRSTGEDTNGVKVVMWKSGQVSVEAE